MKKTRLILSATLLMALPLTFTVPVAPVHAQSLSAQQQSINSLEGHWVDISGRGVLTFEQDGVTFTESTRIDEPRTFTASLQGEKLLLTPTEDSKSARPINASIDWQTQTVSFSNGLYEFIRPPRISAADLDGYWYEETFQQGSKVIRSLHYKDNAGSYDYHWWRVNQGFGTYSQGVDRDVPLQLEEGFIFSAPGAKQTYVHYAIRVEGDTIHYVDRNGARWTETRTDTLQSYDVPAGFREMTGR